MGFYDEMAQTATSLIAEFGQACEVWIEKAGSYEVETGEISVQRKKVAAHCYFNHRHFDFNHHYFEAAKGSKAELIKQGDVLVYLSVNERFNEAELIGSTLKVGSSQWRIVHCQPLKPAAQAVFYQLQARLDNGNI